MAFPDDYRRVRFVGGIDTVLDTQVGESRQVMVDLTNNGLRLMDGVTPGGWPVVMDHQLPTKMEAAIDDGEVSFVENPIVNDPTQPKLFWKSGTLNALFAKLADLTNPLEWLIKDTALRGTIRKNAVLIADCDTADETGWYRFNPSATLNIPVEISVVITDQHMMQVIRQNSNELTQIIFDRSAAGKIWTRSRVGGVFQSWNMSIGITSADIVDKMSRTGDTMTGKLTTRVGGLTGAQLNPPNGVAPTVKVDGDIWRDDAKLS